MENWLKFCLSLCLLLSAGFFLSHSDRLSNETYHKLDINERRKLSADYLSLAKTLEVGSPKAMRLLDKAARINPENELVWKEKSWPYLYSGQYNKWHEFMDKAIALNPQEWQGNRGYVKLAFFKDYGGALYDFEAHDTIKTDIAYSGRVFSTYYLKGLCYLGLENYEQATAALQSYLETEKKKTGSFEINPMAYIYLGLIENDHQHYNKALVQLEIAMAEKSPLADAYYHAAYANFMLGRSAKADKQIDRAMALFEEDNYNKDRLVEVQHQIYQQDLQSLKDEIACFL